MNNYNVTFTENNVIFNVVSKAVLLEDVANELLKRDRVGKNLHEEFVTSRIQDSFTKKINKKTLKTFKSQLPVIRKKVNCKVIKLREEK